MEIELFNIKCNLFGYGDVCMIGLTAIMFVLFLFAIGKIRVNENTLYYWLMLPFILLLIYWVAFLGIGFPW